MRRERAAGGGARQADPLSPALGKVRDEAMCVSPESSTLTEKDQQVLGAMGRGRGANPEGNLNNGILFLYINKCSEKSQI